jgi:rod shape-determining protein MreC
MRKKISTTFLITGITFLIILIAHYLGWIQKPENFLRNLFTPILSSTHTLNIKVGEKYEFFKNKEDFFKAYHECSLKGEGVETLEATNKLLVQENDSLKKQLSFIQGLKTKSISTNVIGNDVMGTEKIIILNSGSTQGVNIGDPVLTEAGLLVGRITSVENSTSIARLITHHQSRFQASILNKDQSLGVVEGGYGGNLRMQFVPRSEAIAVNDQIITSGFEERIPRGLVLGRVVEVENEAYQGFQKITLVPSTNLSKLTTVSILITQ